MTSQFNVFLLLLGALQGALLSLYLLRNQKAHLANIYFVLILVVAGLQLTFKVLSKVWLMENYRLPYFMSYSLPYLVGPLLFLYIRARAGLKFQKIDLLHYIPYLLSISALVIQYYNPWQYWYLGTSAYGRATIQMLSLGIYAYLASRLIQKEKALNRLKSFLVGLVCVEIIIIITLAVMYIYHKSFPDVRLLFVALTIFIYWISYKQLEQPNLFVIKDMQPTVQLHVQGGAKYNHSSLKAEEANRISGMLKNVMHQQKLFLNADLSIDALADQLNVSRHHISQVLNERLQLTYSDYINDLRLTEAKARLQSAKYNHYTIAAIAMDSGFSSVSNFNELFKRKFNQTPSQCRGEGLGKMTA